MPVITGWSPKFITLSNSSCSAYGPGIRGRTARLVSPPQVERFASCHHYNLEITLIIIANTVLEHNYRYVYIRFRIGSHAVKYGPYSVRASITYSVLASTRVLHVYYTYCQPRRLTGLQCGPARTVYSN